MNSSSTSTINQITYATFQDFCPKIGAEGFTRVQTFQTVPHKSFIPITKYTTFKVTAIRLVYNVVMGQILVCTHLHLNISTEKQNVHVFVQRIYSLQNSTNFMCISISNIDDITSHKIFINTYRYTIINANNHLFLRKLCASLYLNCDPCNFCLHFFFSW